MDPRKHEKLSPQELDPNEDYDRKPGGYEDLLFWLRGRVLNNIHSTVAKRSHRYTGEGHHTIWLDKPFPVSSLFGRTSVKGFRINNGILLVIYTPTYQYASGEGRETFANYLATDELVEIAEHLKKLDDI